MLRFCESAEPQKGGAHQKMRSRNELSVDDGRASVPPNRHPMRHACAFGGQVQPEAPSQPKSQRTTESRGGHSSTTHTRTRNCTGPVVSRFLQRCALPRRFSPSRLCPALPQFGTKLPPPFPLKQKRALEGTLREVRKALTESIAREQHLAQRLEQQHRDLQATGPAHLGAGAATQRAARPTASPSDTAAPAAAAAATARAGAAGGSAAASAASAASAAGAAGTAGAAGAAGHGTASHGGADGCGGCDLPHEEPPGRHPPGGGGRHAGAWGSRRCSGGTAGVAGRS